MLTFEFYTYRKKRCLSILIQIDYVLINNLYLYYNCRTTSHT